MDGNANRSSEETLARAGYPKNEIFYTLKTPKST
jgi:hypothetical protein